MPSRNTCQTSPTLGRGKQGFKMDMMMMKIMMMMMMMMMMSCVFWGNKLKCDVVLTE